MSAVCVRAMLDGDNCDHFSDPIDDAEVTASRGMQSLEFETEWLAHSLGIFRQRSVDELNSGRRRLLWQAGQRAPCRRGPGNRMNLVSHERNDAKSASFVSTSVSPAASSPRLSRICSIS